MTTRAVGDYDALAESCPRAASGGDDDAGGAEYRARCARGIPTASVRPRLRHAAALAVPRRGADGATGGHPQVVVVGGGGIGVGIGGGGIVVGVGGGPDRDLDEGRTVRPRPAPAAVLVTEALPSPASGDVPVIGAADFPGLFDTSLAVSGADVDIARYIPEGRGRPGR